MTPLYHESHVTLDPVFGERLADLKRVCLVFGFRVADLLMQKDVDGAPERSTLDSFCTGRSPELEPIRTLMFELIARLKVEGFVVRRFKIENVIIDSRYDTCGT